MDSNGFPFQSCSDAKPDSNTVLTLTEENRAGVHTEPGGAASVFTSSTFKHNVAVDSAKADMQPNPSMR